MGLGRPWVLGCTTKPRTTCPTDRTNHIAPKGRCGWQLMTRADKGHVSSALSRHFSLTFFYSLFYSFVFSFTLHLNLFSLPSFLVSLGSVALPLSPSPPTPSPPDDISLMGAVRTSCVYGRNSPREIPMNDAHRFHVKQSPGNNTLVENRSRHNMGKKNMFVLVPPIEKVFCFTQACVLFGLHPSRLCPLYDTFRPTFFEMLVSQTGGVSFPSNKPLSQQCIFSSKAFR